MRSILIRFTDHKFIQTYLDDDLYMSSLSKFWNIGNSFEDQRDIFEGLAAMLPKDKIPKELYESLGRYTVYDARFRMEAYQYCNLQCFFRVDVDDQKHTIQLPDSKMDAFGDYAIIVKNENQFTNLVIDAVRKTGGDCIIGDVRYHGIADRAELGARPKHTVTVMSAEKREEEQTGDPVSDLGLYDYNDLVSKYPEHTFHYGCLDKFDRYKNQKEWRICYLPVEKDTKDVKLHVPGLSSCLEFLPAKDLRTRLLQMEPGTIPGIVEGKRTYSRGTMHYRDFINVIEKIDGRCRIALDIG